MCNGFDLPIEYSLPKNLEILKCNELFTLLDLTILICSHANLNKTELDAIKGSICSQSYRGCDFLFSNTWPYDMHQFLGERYLI